MNIGQWVLVKAVVVKQRATEGNVSIWRCPCKPFRAQVTGSRVIYHG